MNSFKNIAFQVLKEVGKPLHYREITDMALKKGLITTEGKTPWATMNALLSTDVALKGKGSLFKRVAPGQYILNPESFVTKTVAKVTKTHFIYDKKGNIVETKEKIWHFATLTTLTSKQKGDIAEARVMELIVLYGNEGLSCYKPVSDDEGIDVIVKRRGELDVVYVQVKSTFGYPPHRGFVSTVNESHIKNKERMLLVFVFFDLTSGDLFDNIFCIPASKFLKLTDNEKRTGRKRVFTVNLREPGKSKYAEFMIEKRELANRIIEIMDKL